MSVPTRFPVSDHCDGERFFNPDGRSARPFCNLPKWWWQQITGTRKHWPAALPAAPTPILPEKISDGQIAATFIGHATTLVQLPGLNVLTDPVFSRRAGPGGIFGPPRVQPPALPLEGLPRIDLILLSHNHYDHCDLASLRWLSARHRPAILAPLGLKSWLEARGVANVTELDWWQSHRLQPAIEAVCAPAQHWSSRWPWDRCRTLWSAWFLKTPPRAVYFAGDTAWGGHFAETRRRLGAPDLALLPVGAYEPRWFMETVHMNPDEAVRAHLALGAKRSVGIHHSTFRLTDESFEAPRQDLQAALVRQGVAPGDFLIPACGETVSPG